MRIPYDAPRTVGRQYIELSQEITATIFVIVIAGWQRARQFADVNPSAREVLMTERLRDGMREEVNSRRGPLIVVLQGSESRSNTGITIPNGRTDIPLFFIEVHLRTQEHDPHAIIECKRISGSDADLCREYVVEGINRFSSGKYGENHAIGFMVGYLLSGTASEAATGVNRYLSRKSRPVENLIRSGLSDEPPSWESEHARPSPMPSMWLHHAFLEVTASVP